MVNVNGGSTFQVLYKLYLSTDVLKYKVLMPGSALYTPGAFRLVLGGQTVKSLGKLSNGWTDWHLIWYPSEDSSGNGHRLKTIRSTLPQGRILGGFRVSTIKKNGKCGQTAGPIGNKFCTYNADESGNGHRLNKLAP